MYPPNPFPLIEYRLAFSLCPLRALRLCGYKKISDSNLRDQLDLYSFGGKGVTSQSK
jgi:hypothetical protein